MPPRAAPVPATTTRMNITTDTSSSADIPQKARTIMAYSELDTKIVLLGAQGVGKTSIIHRFLDPKNPINVKSTIGAAFHNKKTFDQDTNTTVRMQIWDTAGQERFRSISRLYYRNASATILCYDVTSEQSWHEMKCWLEELRENCDFSFNEHTPGTGMILHIVGTKLDLVTLDANKREVPFERTVAFIAEHLSGLSLTASQSSTSPQAFKSGSTTATSVKDVLSSPDSKRSSGFWTSDIGWDSCHEVSAQDNDGIEEVFRVISKKLIQQRDKREAYDAGQTPWLNSGSTGGASDYFGSGSAKTGSFRLGHGRRKSWLGLPMLTGIGAGAGIDQVDGQNSAEAAYTSDPDEARKRGRCC